VDLGLDKKGRNIVLYFCLGLRNLIYKRKSPKTGGQKKVIFKKNGDSQVAFDKDEDNIMPLYSFIRNSSQETTKPPKKISKKPELYSLDQN